MTVYLYIIPRKDEVLEKKIIEKLRKNNPNENMVSFVYLDEIDYSEEGEDESKKVSEEDRKQYYDWVRKSILKPIFNKT